MKNNILYVALVILSTTALTACLKKSVAPAQTPGQLIAGNWSIVSDSLTYVAAGAQVVMYVGKPGDYYRFAQNGLLYINKDNVADTAKYAITDSNQLNLSYLNIDYNDGFVISAISENNLTLTSNNATNPAMNVFETVKLKR